MLGAIDGFRGTKRFILEGQLGEGGMGVVHRARDVERGEVVALKTMTRLDAASLLRFKREFRALADIVHDNVVQLYELFSEGDQWFFTMELVDGVDLITWVHSSLSMPPPAMPPPRDTRMAADALVSGVQATLLAPTELFEEILARSSGKLPAAEAAPGMLSSAPPAPRVRFFVRDVGRLRAAFRQLASGVATIHARGKLHRDLKPSNVIVSRSGRVVILDFGVVGEYRPGETGERGEETLVGTPAYMAPEQAAFQPATPASDWYAVGVMMFEALTQRMPFEGSTTELLLAKQRPLGSRPRDLVEGIPEDLEQLCVDLLQVDPALRPSAEEILRRLEGDRTPAISASVEIPFVGRRAQIDALHAAFDASRTGPPVAVMLHGRSGMGKSALAARFLGQLEARPDTLVLSGRCYDREAVPFKAIDQVVDELSRWLARLPEEEAYALLPAQIHALARLFPVLKNARVIADAPPDTLGVFAEPLEVRRRAFGALKQLLEAIAARWHVVVHIDDLQWGDADSVQLLEAILTPPSPRPLLLVCGHRSESAASSEALELLRRTLGSLGSACKVREVEVGALSPREAQELARALVDSSDPAVPAAIAAEAQGSPLFVAELGRWANERGGEIARGGGGSSIALDEMIAARVAELPEDARALLEAVSIAGRPVEHAIVESASGTAGRRRPASLALRAAHFVSMRGLRDDDLVETSHDRIRETVVAGMDEASRRLRHLALARAYSGSSRADPEAAFEHFRAGGDDASARDFALRAAEAADQGLAFLRAARLYRAAIELGAEQPEQLYARLGDALANAGRGAEAADAYMEAAARSTGRDALNLRRVAAEHLLKAGHDERGIAVLQQVLSEVGVRYPESTQAAVASLLWHEARLRVARLTRTLRRPQSLSPRLLDRFDAAFAAATGLTTSDLLRSADFANRALILALEAGEPVRLGRALAVAAGNVAARGESARRRADALVRAAQQVAAQVDDPHGRALALLAGGFVHFFLGEWRGARAKLEEAEAILRTRCRAVAWELANTQAWTCNVLILSGELRDATRRVPGIVEEARSRDDSFALMHLTYPACCAHIVSDDVDAAWRVTELAATHAGGGAFTSFHWGSFISGCSVERYRGDGRAAWERVQRTSPALDASSLSRIALVRTFSAYERGLSAIAAAAEGHDRTAALAAADDWARRLSKESVSFAPAMGHLLRAGASAVRADRKRAEGALELAIPALDAADLGYLAACARHRRGELLGGSTGAELVARSRSFFSAQGIVNPERCLQMSAPGFY